MFAFGLETQAQRGVTAGRESNFNTGLFGEFLKYRLHAVMPRGVDVNNLPCRYITVISATDEQAYPK